LENHNIYQEAEMKKNILAAVIFIFAGLFSYCYVSAEGENGSLIKFDKGDRYVKILVSSRAVEALGKLGGLKSEDVLIQGLKSKEFFIRAYAAEALGRLNDKKAIPALEEVINDSNYLVRIYVVKALVKLGEAGRETLLLSFLSDKNPAIRTSAVEQLGDFGEKYMPVLFQFLLKENVYYIREKMIEYLGNNKFQPAADYIMQALGDSSLYVRKAAIEAISQIKEDRQSYAKEVKKLLDDNDTSVRAKAMEILSLTEDSSLRKLLWQDVEAQDPYLKAGSYVALANLKDMDILPILLKAVITPENSIFVRVEAARALKILQPYVLEAVNKTLAKSKDKSPSIENLEINYKVGGRNLILLLLEALKNVKNPLHKDSPLILNQLAEEISFPALRQALIQTDPETAAASAYVLGELNDKDAVTDLIRLCEKYGF